MIIDFHVHSFPEKIAEKTLNFLADAAKLNYYNNGTIPDIKEKFKTIGIDKFVLLNIATKPTQQKTINDVAAENNNGNVFAFGSVHPDADDNVSELHRIKKLGLKGIKLHPEYQQFNVDDKKVYKIYEECQTLGLIIVFHAGVDLGILPPVHSTPDRIGIVANDFPKLNIVAAHMGGFQCWDMSTFYLAKKDNIWLDTSFGVKYIHPKRFKMMCDEHGMDKILFGTDSPWSEPKSDIDAIQKSIMNQNDLDRIFYKNAENLLNI